MSGMTDETIRKHFYYAQKRLEEERQNVETHFNPQVEAALAEGDIDGAHRIVQRIPCVVVAAFALDKIREAEKQVPFEMTNEQTDELLRLIKEAGAATISIRDCAKKLKIRQRDILKEVEDGLADEVCLNVADGVQGVGYRKRDHVGDYTLEWLGDE
jgi:hypothetical protein